MNFAQEFRFATSGRNKVDFVAGVFGYRQTIKTLGLQAQGGAANQFTNGPTQNPAVLDGLTQTNRIAFENNSFAAYALRELGVTLDQARTAVMALVAAGTTPVA